MYILCFLYGKGIGLIALSQPPAVAGGYFQQKLSDKPCTTQNSRQSINIFFCSPDPVIKNRISQNVKPSL